MSKRAIWDTTIGLAGFIYVFLVFFQNIQSPLFAGAFILAASYELIESHKVGPGLPACRRASARRSAKSETDP
ncbi:MAG TPA: hypothetical protein VLY24_19775 [Bryobacteraceae bacterium]|nr:hypothetical protein [Bryobacteraceae bacterium]